MLAALIELAPSGVEQVDGDGFTEFALYGAPGELPSFPEGQADVGGVVVQVSGREVPDDWSERWKRFHRPVMIGGRIYVRPPWEEPAVRPGVTEIVIDPGQAFGTGTHRTTALCLELMLDLKQRGSFADLGCGSGVLAIAAAKLGFAPVTAVDAERQAIDATRRNANDNGVALDRLAEQWEDERPPLLIVSGLLDHEAGEVAAAFAPLRERKRLSSLGWSALLLA